MPYQNYTSPYTNLIGKYKSQLSSLKEKYKKPEQDTQRRELQPGETEHTIRDGKVDPVSFYRPREQKVEIYEPTQAPETKVEVVEPNFSDKKIEVIKEPTPETAPIVNTPPVSVNEPVKMAKKNTPVKKEILPKTADEMYKIIATVIGEGIGEGERGMHAILNNVIARAERGYRGATMFDVVSAGDGAQYNAFDVGNPLYKQTLDYLRGEGDASDSIKNATKKIQELISAYSDGTLEDIIGRNMNYQNPAVTNDRQKRKSGYDKRDKSKDITVGNHVFWSD